MVVGWLLSFRHPIPPARPPASEQPPRPAPTADSWRLAPRGAGDQRGGRGRGIDESLNIAQDNCKVKGKHYHTVPFSSEHR